MDKPTRNELSQLYFLNREIEHDQEQIERLQARLEGGAIVITGMPNGSLLTDMVGEYVAEIENLKSIVSLKLERCYRELNRLNRYIDSVDDSRIRMILSLRFVSGLPWQQVAESIGGGNTANGVRMTVDRFLKE